MNVSVLPEVIFAGLLCGIDEWVLDEVPLAPDTFNGQDFGMNTLMVMRAQRQAIVDARGTVIRPVLNVVQFAPGSRPVTTGNSTTAVASKDRPTHDPRKLALFTPDGEHFPLSGEGYR